MPNSTSRNSGLIVATSDFSVSETIDRMISIIDAQGWHLFARIDHAEQARKKGLVPRPTQVILFGNPEIGTLLMQDQQSAALDPPMKLLAWEDTRARVQIIHNDLRWLQQRYALADTSALQAIDGMLTRLRTSARKARG
ncbi:MAG: DUF302 domain-containing protein [Gammaproteobacteria bacterium]